MTMKLCSFIRAHSSKMSEVAITTSVFLCGGQTIFLSSFTKSANKFFRLSLDLILNLRITSAM